MGSFDRHETIYETKLFRPCLTARVELLSLRQTLIFLCQAKNDLYGLSHSVFPFVTAFGSKMSVCDQSGSLSLKSNREILWFC